MKPKRKTREATKPVAEEPLPQPIEAVTDDADDKSGNRVSLNWYTKDDGKMDVSRMRESMKTRIKEVLPQLVSEFGDAEQTAVATVAAIPDAWVSTLYDILGSIESFAFAKILSIDSEVSRKVFKFTPAEKEQLVPPTARVVNKYAPDWLLKYKDEAALIMMIVVMTTTKIAAAKMLSEIKKASPATPLATAEAKPNGKEAQPKTPEEQKDATEILPA